MDNRGGQENTAFQAGDEGDMVRTKNTRDIVASFLILSFGQVVTAEVEHDFLPSIHHQVGWGDM